MTIDKNAFYHSGLITAYFEDVSSTDWEMFYSKAGTTQGFITGVQYESDNFNPNSLAKLFREGTTKHGTIPVWFYFKDILK